MNNTTILSINFFLQGILFKSISTGRSSFSCCWYDKLVAAVTVVAVVDKDDCEFIRDRENEEEEERERDISDRREN